jgi:hypothetical protein
VLPVSTRERKKWNRDARDGGLPETPTIRNFSEQWRVPHN